MCDVERRSMSVCVWVPSMQRVSVSQQDRLIMITYTDRKQCVQCRCIEKIDAETRKERGVRGG